MQSMVAKIIPIIGAGEAVSLFRSHNPAYADGGQLRDFVYVKDCAAVVRWLLDNGSVNGLFNVGTGTARSFLDLVGAVYARAQELNRIFDLSIRRPHYEPSINISPKPI